MDRRASLKLAYTTILLGLGLAALPTQAGNDSWSVAGSPSGGTVMKVVVNPADASIIYASSGQGLFKSTDSGADWTLIFKTLNGPADFAIDPLSPGTLYLASTEDANRVLFKSTDGGATWATMDNGIGLFPGSSTAIDDVGLIAVDPVTEGTVYAATLDTGVYKSTDGGLIWRAINTGISQLQTDGALPMQLAVDTTHPNILFLNAQVDTTPGIPAPTADAGLYMSVDGGDHWTTTSLTGANMGPFAIDPTDGAHIIACGGTSGVAALSSSTNSGGTWASTTSCPFEVSALSFDPSSPLHLLAGTYENGVYQSNDGGATWTQSSAVNASFVYSVAFDPVTPANLYVGTVSWGLFKSIDGGSTWAVSDNGIHNVVPILMLEGTDEVLYLASAGSGIYKSIDQGVTWTEIGTTLSGPGLLGSIYVYGMAEDPKTPSTLYAGTLSDLYKSIDGGSTWAVSDTGMASTPYILAVAVDPENTSTVYVGTQNHGLYKSTDGGSSWTSAMSGITTLDVMDLAVDPSDSKVVYAGTYDKGLFKSVDGGATWNPGDAGLSGNEVLALAVDPSNHDVIYTSTAVGIYKSSDAGTSWKLASAVFGNVVTNIQIDPNNTSIVYASLAYGIGSAYVSTDAGASWSPLTNGLAAATARRSAALRTARVMSLKGLTASAGSGPVSISSLAVDPVHSAQLFGAGSDGQVYVYNDLNPPTGSTANGSGGNGGNGGNNGGNAGGSSSSSGGGGGKFSLIPLCLLFGLAALRRRVVARR